MGLTIHYSLQTDIARIDDIRHLAGSIREFARDLPFKEVGELVEFQGKDADHDQSGKEDEHRWLKIQAGRYIQNGNHHFSVKPLHLIAFRTWPGEGCEPANIGFCRYPATVDVPFGQDRTKKIRTRLTGWSWGSFCKTQYASDPECGGIQNFLRCHLCVVKLLDFIQKTGLVQVEVSDEGEYWDKRDLGELAREVGEWNQFIAAFSGILKDAAGKNGMVVESAIAGFANFEHLEAKGLERLEQLRKRTKDR